MLRLLGHRDQHILMQTFLKIYVSGASLAFAMSGVRRGLTNLGQHVSCPKRQADDGNGWCGASASPKL